jgi:predicted ATPase/DNA-binding SARP family transcriptional activator
MVDELALRVCILGPIRVVRDGASVAVGSRRQRAILAALALTPGRVVAASDLIGALWGDDAPDGAAGTLQSYVSRLRTIIGTTTLVHEHAGYRLSAAVTTDLADVEHLVREARRVMVDDPALAAQHLGDALSQWQGDALLEFADDHWFLPEAARLRELRATTIDERAGLLLESGEVSEALAELEGHAVAQPLRERTQLLLMRALHAEGRAAEALRVASRFREAVGEVGLVAGPAVAEHEQMVLAEPVAHSEGAGGRARVSSSSRAWVTPLRRGGRFVGRRAELADLAQLVRSERLVSVVAAGGMGKTRLVAELLASDTGDVGEVVVVELAGGGATDVVGMIAAALGSTAAELTTEALVEAVGSARMLLVLDNCEHVHAEVRGLVDVLLRRCPGLTVIATSRMRLDLPDELVLHLPPLTPDTGSTELFVERLRRAVPEVGDGDIDRDRVAEICSALDGVPLAVELAASRAASMGIGALHEGLGDLLGILSPPDSSDRHASLRALVDWSVELLDPEAERLLLVLAVFETAFDRAAAEVVSRQALDGTPARHLDELVEMSLLTSDGEPMRYRMADTVRAFCLERSSTDVLGAARAAHAEWIAAWLAEDHGVGPAELDRWHALQARRDEIRAALRWAVDADRLDLASAITSSLARPLHYRPDPELLEWMGRVAELVLDAPTATPDRPGALGAGARASWLLGDLDRAVRLAGQAIDRAEPDALPPIALHALGVVSLYRGDLDASDRWFGSAHDSARSDLAVRLDALGGIGLVQCYRGALDAAETSAQRLRRQAVVASSDTYLAFADYVAGEVALARGGDQIEVGIDLLEGAVDVALHGELSFVSGIASVALASAVVRHRDTADALARFPSLIGRWRRSATWTQLWTSMRLLAELLVRCERIEVASLILLAADADPAAPAVTGDDRARLDATMARLGEAMGRAGLDDVAALAGSMGRSQIVDRALREVQELLATSGGAGSAQAGRKGLT